MKTVAFRIPFLLLLLACSAAYGQRGTIIKPATSVLDPNQDGYIFIPPGFSNDGYYVDEFEIPMFGIPKLGGDVENDNIGKSCGITDLIPDRDGYSVYAVKDNNNNLIFRFRVGDNQPSVEAWTILLDIDGRIGSEDPNATAFNPGFEIDITLIKRQNAGIYVYNIDGISSCPSPILTYPYSSHFQISIADIASCGDPDYFYDFYVPFADIANAFNIDINTGVRFVAVTNISATCAMAGKIADISGVDYNDYQNDVPRAFLELTNNQCPTSIANLCTTCSGFTQEAIDAPTIDEPVRAGQSIISGTAEAGRFIAVEIFSRIGGTDQDPVWASTPRERKTTYATGGTWAVNLTDPLQAYDRVVARAQISENTVACGGEGNNQASTSTTVVTPNEKPVANNQTIDVLEDTPTVITLTGSDPDNDPLTFVIISSPSNGTLSGLPPNVTYTPNLNYNGPDIFTFKVNDGVYDSDVVGTVTINVVPVNDAPVANDQSVTVQEDVPKPITLTASDVENDPLTFIVVTPPSHGTLSGSGANLTYTPDPDFNGSDSFTFKVNDGTTDSNIATVSITVTPESDAPVANNQTVIVPEDTPTDITLVGSDPDGESVTFIIVSAPSHGTLSGSGPIVTYSPELNYNGPDSFTFKVNDGTTDSNIATVSITVTPVNDEPIANDQSVTVQEDVPKPITLTASDVDNDPLTFIVVTQPSHGTLSGSGPNLIYTPDLDYNGPDSFTFKVNDGTTDSNIATVSITVNPDSDAPVANNQTVIVPEDTPTAITLTGSDPDGDPLTFIIVSPPSHGTLSGSGPNLTYSPDLNYNGPDSFTFKVNDGTTDSNIATVSITVTPVNDEPVANNQNVTYDLNTPKAITLTGSDPDGDALTFIIVTQPSNGTLSGSAPNVTYTPDPGFDGTDTFTFKVNDGTTDSNIATVTLNPTPLSNSSPVASNQTVIVQEDVPKAIILGATDIDGDALTYIIVTPPSHGTLSGTGANVTYSPNLNYNGPDSFTFKVNDGTTDSNIATVSITVVPVNDAPIADNQSITTPEDTPKLITLSGSDVEGDALTFIIVAQPAHGTLSGSGANVTYTPALNYNGPDSFTFKVNDGSTDSNVATVSITVTPVNDAPVANNQSVTVQEDTPKAITLSATDVDGDALTYSIVSPPTHGTLSGTGPSLTYTPNLNYNGPDSFTFKVSDGTLESNTATVSITVVPVNDAPVANSQSITTPEDVAKDITLTGSDVEGDPLTFIIVAPPSHGSLSGTGANRTYTPNLNYFGPDSFTFKVNDGGTDSNIATVSITVTPVNDPPVANNQTVIVQEDTPKSIILSGSDVDGDALTYFVVTQPAHGTLSGSGSNLTYSPSLNYTGPDSFTFKVNDGTVDSNIGTVSITVVPVNDAPIADDQQVTTQEDVAKNITLTGSDADGDELTFIVVSQPTNGTLTGSAPNLTYTPDLNYNGADSFTFKVNDGTTDSNIATVSITVTPVNDAPVISALPVLTTKEDSIRQVCLNVVDVDSDNISFVQPTNTKGGGTMVRDAAPFDFCYIFTPAPNYNGEAIWQMMVSDSEGLVGTTSVKIIITPVNDPPVAFNDYVDVDSRGSLQFNVLDNDHPIAPPYKEFYDIYEADSTDVIVLKDIISGPLHGTLNSSQPDGTITYSPEFGYMGADSIKYRVCDSGNLCDTAVVFIEVGPPPFKIYEGVSANGDNKNDYWRIDGIEQFPNNRVRIFDRYNNVVFDTRSYANEGNNWHGQSNNGLVSGSLPEGTYFYQLNLGEGSKVYSGYIILKRN